MLRSRIIFAENRFDDVTYSKSCYTKITLKKVDPAISIEEGDEFNEENLIDEAYLSLCGRRLDSSEELKKINSLEIEFDVLVEVEENESDPSVPFRQFKGTFKYDSNEHSRPDGSLATMDATNWINWCFRLLVIGSLDNNYKFELAREGEHIYFTVRRKVNGIFIVVFRSRLEEEGEEVDIMGDLYALYKVEVFYKKLVNEWKEKSLQMERNWKESEASKAIYVETNKKIRDSVENIFIPLINEQKAQFRELKKELGEKQDLNFSSTRTDQLINYQEPNKSIKFEFDESKAAEYQKEIEKLSPRKKKKKKKKKAEEVDDDHATDSQVTDKDIEEDFEPTLRRKMKIEEEEEKVSEDTTEDTTEDTIDDPTEYDDS